MAGQISWKFHLKNANDLDCGGRYPYQSEGEDWNQRKFEIVKEEAFVCLIFRYKAVTVSCPMGAAMYVQDGFFTGTPPKSSEVQTS